MDHPGLLPSPADVLGSLQEAVRILLPWVAAAWRSADRATTAPQLDIQLTACLTIIVSRIYAMSAKV
jgi:hypothetical protein